MNVLQRFAVIFCSHFSWFFVVISTFAMIRQDRLQKGAVMDVTSIAALATDQTQKSQSQAINTLVEKKAIDSQKTLAEGLIAAIPPSPVTSSMGHTVNTLA
jgi:hypothetical protein